MAVTFTVLDRQHHFLTYRVFYDGVFAGAGNVVVRTNAQILADIDAPPATPGPLRDEISRAYASQGAVDLRFSGRAVDVLVHHVGFPAVPNAPAVNPFLNVNVVDVQFAFLPTADEGNVLVTLRYQGRAGVAAGR
jgi:hypothetical protein